jgi:hypothetical protein
MDEFNELEESHLAAAKMAVVEAARGLRCGALPFVEAVRSIAALRFGVPGAQDDPDFLLFTAIDSVTDHIPAAHTRARCTASWLLVCDREVCEIAEARAGEIDAACERILKSLDVSD